MSMCYVITWRFAPGRPTDRPTGQSTFGHRRESSYSYRQGASIGGKEAPTLGALISIVMSRKSDPFLAQELANLGCRLQAKSYEKDNGRRDDHYFCRGRHLMAHNIRKSASGHFLTGLIHLDSIGTGLSDEKSL